MSSTAPPADDTRAGGRCNVPVLRSREPTKRELPVLGAAGGGGRHAGGLGPAGRLDGDHAAPGEELAVRQLAAGGDLRRRRSARTDTRPIASVVRNSRTSAPSASTTSAMTWPGSACSSALASSSPGWAAPVLPTVDRQVVDDRAVGSAEPSSSSARTARACSPAMTTTRSTCVGRRCSAAFERGVPGLLAERHVLRLAEALLPHLRAAIARRAPAVEELLGRRRRCRGTRRSPGRRRRPIAHEHGRRAVTTGGLVRAGRQAGAQVAR